MTLKAAVKVLPIVLFVFSLGDTSAESPFSGATYVAFANTLWEAIEANKLIG
ncbi:MAG: hypothetical protein ACI9UN_004385 [Granulosicoccus sp.]|jgi:hypothetical protein